jgi:hypothetical protein
MENQTLIATRVPPGDQWSLINETQVYKSLTDVLEAHHQKHSPWEFPPEYKINPHEGKIFLMGEKQNTSPPSYTLYGEQFNQGI